MAKIGDGFEVKDGKVVAVQRKRMAVSDRIRQRKSKSVKPVRRGTITHGKPKGNSG